MRIGVIRGDLPGPIFLADLEPVSQYNPSTEPRGQERYLSRPTVAEIEAALSNATRGAGATIEGSDISGSFPITITGANDDLKVKTDPAAAYTTVLIAQATYANITTLLAAVNLALTGTGITARQGTGSGQRVAIESNTKGVNSYLQIDSTAGGSVANTPLGFGASSITRTMPSGATYITALNPVGGTLDVSSATINAVGATTNSNALNLIPSNRGTVTAIQDAIAPKFAETPVAVDSYLVGKIAGFRNAAYCPDSRRVPALPSSAAISVVQDDGVTAFAATLPTVASAVLSGGNVTITGTGLGSGERDETTVKFGGNVAKVLVRKIIVAAGGSVSQTSIVIPASLVPGVAISLSTVQVKVRHRASSVVAVS